ncbi:lasso peptide biosynthesis PqqD family chaperone [Embleya sp. NPDC005971]|uniref:lasso peptide biosynthesis PqqD family chaperone n=1 Tax=Embleya sp. NPDC005971 TaxID=3156724 RepID=UPI00340748B6
MTFALRPNVIPTPTEHGTVLLDERRGRYFQLNPTGTLVLGALLNGATAHQAATLLSDRYSITLEQAAADVTALLDSLRKKKLATP